MIHSIGRTVLLVDDYDEALAFYRDILGFETIVDIDAGNGDRYVHVGLPSQQGVGIWFMKPGSRAEAGLVGMQTGGQPTMVMYTDDCVGTYDRLVEAEVRIVRGLKKQGGARFFHFSDLYGNEVVVVELKAQAVS